MKLPKVTQEQMNAWDPCEAHAANVAGVTGEWPLDALVAIDQTHVRWDHRLWAVLRVEMLPEPLLTLVMSDLLGDTIPRIVDADAKVAALALLAQLETLDTDVRFKGIFAAIFASGYSTQADVDEKLAIVRASIVTHAGGLPDAG